MLTVGPRILLGNRKESPYPPGSLAWHEPPDLTLQCSEKVHVVSSSRGIIFPTKEVGQGS